MRSSANASEVNVVWRSHAPSAEKSEGSGDIAIPYQFSWNVISNFVVKLEVADLPNT